VRLDGVFLYRLTTAVDVGDQLMFVYVYVLSLGGQRGSHNVGQASSARTPAPTAGDTEPMQRPSVRSRSQTDDGAGAPRRGRTASSDEYRSRDPVGQVDVRLCQLIGCVAG